MVQILQSRPGLSPNLSSKIFTDCPFREISEATGCGIQPSANSRMTSPVLGFGPNEVDLRGTRRPSAATW